MVSKEFPFSDSLKFPTYKKHITYDFSENLLNDIFEPRQNIVVCTGGSLENNLISLSFVNAFKFKYNGSKNVSFSGFSKFKNLFNYTQHNIFPLYIHNLYHQYPSPIFLNKDTVFINCLFSLPNNGKVVKPLGIENLWKNTMMLWDNSYKERYGNFRSRDRIYNKFNLNSKWPLLVILKEDVGDFLTWENNQLELFIKMISNKKINIVIISSLYKQFKKYKNVLSLNYSDITALRFVRLAHYLFTSDKSWARIALSCSNTSIIGQAGLQPLVRQTELFSSDNQIIEVDDFQPEDAYRILYG